MIRQVIKTIEVLSIVLLIGIIGSAGNAEVKEKISYRVMIDEVGNFLNEALNKYKKGNIQEAKSMTQAAYFEVYENLEGPIRVNVSAQKNYELEEEFVAIRKMIVNNEPAGALEKKINGFMSELRAIAPELEGGVELAAESDPGKSRFEAVETLKDIHPLWQQAFDRIASGLRKALAAYMTGDRNTAAQTVVQTQFEDYKNTLLETAVRRYVSQKKDFENNSSFTEITKMIRRGEAPEKVETQIAALMKDLQEDLPGLPVIEGAADARGAGNNPGQNSPHRDWSAVAARLFSELDRSISNFENGDTRGAVAVIQDAYFDVFEASGMEAKIGARDAAFKAKLEGHFNLIVGSMKSGARAATLKIQVEKIKADFKKAADMLGNGKDSAATLFFYSLMIIVREGIEAILIITAIIAYLVKTGNRDKLRVIYNGCISAIVLSVITAVLVKRIFRTSAASQEAMEGATMLLASAVLFSVSYWLISKAEAQKWMAYIKEKVGNSVSANSLRALWFASFLAVYREGAETVLFYQALAADAGAAGVPAVAGGFVIGCVLLVGIYLTMSRGAVKLPLRPFFLFTGGLLFYMAFVFAGKGVMELISGKMFEPTLVSWIPTVEFIGLYPYVQTLAPQFLISSAAAAGLIVVAARRKSIAVKAVSKENLSPEKM